MCSYTHRGVSIGAKNVPERGGSLEISYDVVKVGRSYGSVFELLNARSFSKILSTEPEKMDWCVKEYVELLKKIHSTLVPAGKLPDMKETVLSWAKIGRAHV